MKNKPANKCPAPGVYVQAQYCWLYEGEFTTANGTQQLVSNCPGGCVLDGACVSASDQATCDVNRPLEVECESCTWLIFVFVGFFIVCGTYIAIDLTYCLEEEKSIVADDHYDDHYQKVPE